jgi:CBS domain-containing protein
MKASEIMTTPVLTVRADASVRDAATLLAERAITSIPVIDEDGKIVGILSEVDVIRDRLPHDPRSHLRRDQLPTPDPGQRVRDVMCKTVICLGANADTADIAALMLNNNVRAVPIVDGMALLGIVSRRDLLRTLVRPDAAIREEILQRIGDYTGTTAPWQVTVDEGSATIKGAFNEGARKEIVIALARAVPGVLRVHIHTKHDFAHAATR